MPSVLVPRSQTHARCRKARLRPVTSVPKMAERDWVIKKRKTPGSALYGEVGVRARVGLEFRL